MPKRTRKASNKSLTSWPKILVIIIPVFAAAFILVQGNGGSVLGEKDTNLFGFSEKKKASISPKPSPKPQCNRVTSFSASYGTDSEENAFATYSYTCKDGTTGTLAQVSGKKMHIEKAFQMARKECNRKCKPTKSPSAAPTETTVE